MPKKKEEKKPKVEAEVLPEPKVEAKVSKKKAEEAEDLGTLGRYKIKIHKISKIVLNGREYNDVHLINGQTMLLSDEDLKKQLHL